MKNYNLMYAADFYKVSHKAQYPANVTKVHSALVARGANYNEDISKDEFMWFGLKLYLDKLKGFETWFVGLTSSEFTDELQKYKQFLDMRLGGNNNVDHWDTLWERMQTTGKLPLIIHAVEEKTICNFQTPLLTVENTHDDFAWLTSYIESTMLSNVWPVTTAANRSWHIRKSIEERMVSYTEEELGTIDFMGHDFSYRGLMGDEAAVLAGCGHLANFKGSDTIPAIKAMEDIYGEVTGFSVPATEHSVMCAGGETTEFETYKRILDIYPSGIVSIVSDTWDYYAVLKEILPQLKNSIMARDGKVVIRPDSGDPVKIVCGGDGYESSLEILDGIFGHTLDSAGLKVLDSHIGLIYGDGMNQPKIKAMLDEMIKCGYSPLNIVFGIGSYTYQFMTRDELSFAFKATAVEIDGKWVDIHKNPKTDVKKKSLTGRFVGGNLKKVF